MTVEAPEVPDLESADRRERRRQRTVAAIRQAARDLVAEHGLDAVSVAMIADRADVGYRTFFNYFSCKEEALVGPDLYAVSRVITAFEARPTNEEPLDALISALKSQFIDFEHKREEICAHLALVDANPELLPLFNKQYAEMEHQIAAAVARRTGIAECDLYPHLLAAIVSTALRTCSVRWSASGSVGSPVDLLDEAHKALGRGMLPPKLTTKRGCG